MTLLPLWTSLAGQARPCLLRRVWDERLGSESVAALERLGLLANAPRAQWLPCTGDCGGVEHRAVEPTPVGENRWRVVCRAGLGCLPDEVPGEELEVLTAEGASLATWLRRQLRATGQPVRSEQPGVYGLGRLPWRGEVREGFLVTGQTTPRLRLLLRDLDGLMVRRLVLVPRATALTSELQGMHGPDAPTTLIGLEDVLDLRAGQLLLRLPDALTAPPAGLVETPAGIAYLPGGPQRLSRRELDALAERAHEFDLFVDMTRVVEGSRHPASRRDPEEGVQPSSLTRNEAAAVVELVRARAPLAQRDFKKVSVSSMRKLIDAVRGNVDVSEGRYRWRSIHTLKGDTPETKRWAFRPPADLRFAVLAPLDE